MGGGDGPHHPIPHARFPPSYKAVVAGGARTIALGQIAPRRTGSQHPEDAVQHPAVIDARHASGLVGQQRLDHAPFEVSQVIAAHADAESEHDAFWKPPVNETFYEQDALSLGRFCHSAAVSKE